MTPVKPQPKVLQQRSNLTFDTEKFCHLERVVDWGGLPLLGAGRPQISHPD